MISQESCRRHPAPAKESAEDKAKREELLKKNAEIAASNKKAEESNAIVERTFKAGNDALNAKNYDVAITQYDEGLAADPEHPARLVVDQQERWLSTRRGVARLQRRRHSRRMTPQKLPDLDAAKKDWTAASESSAKAVTLLKAMPAPTDPAAANSCQDELVFCACGQSRCDADFSSLRSIQTKVDEGVTAYQEYIAAETDPVKKAKARTRPGADALRRECLR